jgi:hypothetical protein
MFCSLVAAHKLTCWMMEFMVGSTRARANGTDARAAQAGLLLPWVISAYDYFCIANHLLPP